MGKNMLDQIKGSPEARATLKEIMEDMAKFVEDDDPPMLFGQKLLSMATTVPGFAAALVEFYKSTMENILKGVIDSGPAKDVLLSEKGKAFWNALHQYIKDYYNAQSAPPSPPSK